MLSKKNIAAHLQFDKDYVDKQEDYWRKVHWTEYTYIYIFGLNEKCYVWRKEKNFILSVKHGVDNIMDWACFAASGPRRLAMIDRTIHFE